MKKNLLLSCAVILFMLFSSCKKNDMNGADGIGYGTSFGMRTGYCVQKITISGQQVAFLKSKNGPAPDTKNCSKNISKDDIDEIAILLKKSEFDTFPAVIGCPDCADGGAEWIEVTTNSEKRKVAFDYNNAPAKLRPLAEKLRAIRDSFSDCN